jgi:hypothetical protein
MCPTSGSTPSILISVSPGRCRGKWNKRRPQRSSDNGYSVLCSATHKSRPSEELGVWVLLYITYVCTCSTSCLLTCNTSQTVASPMSLTLFVLTGEPGNVPKCTDSVSSISACKFPSLLKRREKILCYPFSATRGRPDVGH